MKDLLKISSDKLEDLRPDAQAKVKEYITLAKSAGDNFLAAQFSMGIGEAANDMEQFAIGFAIREASTSMVELRPQVIEAKFPDGSVLLINHGNRYARRG